LNKNATADDEKQSPTAKKEHEGTAAQRVIKLFRKAVQIV
jgi:hypothetical protein